MENNNTWQRIYDLAARIYNLSPWNSLDETDVFGVLSPDTGKSYFVSIMGSEHVLPAVAAYEGSEALYRFWMLENTETADGSDVLTIPHLILSFETAEDIDPDQLKRFRAIHNDPVFTDRFPEVRKVVPGLYPGEPDETALNELILVLEQTLDVCMRAADDASFIQPDDQDEDIYLMRELQKGGWTDHYRETNTELPGYLDAVSEEVIAAIESLPESQSVMQAHAQLLPFPVKQEGKPVMFPFLVILVNKKSGRIENSTMLVSEPDFDTMLAKVPALYLDFIRTLGFKPRSVEVKSNLVFDMLHDVLLECGIRVLQFKQIPALEEAVKAIMESMRKH